MPWICSKSVRTVIVFLGLALAAVQIAGCSSREQRAQNHYEQGHIYLEQKEYVKARLEFRNALQLKSDMVEAWRGLAEIDEHDRNWQGLAGSLRRIVELDEKDVPTRIKLVRILMLAGANDDALKMANAAGELAPQNPEVMALKAAILIKLKDTEGSLRLAQAALAIDRDNADASIALAVAKYSQGDVTAALQALDNVADARKNDVGILAIKINILQNSGRLDQAEALMHRLVELHPKEPAFRTQLIRFYLLQKRQDDAVRELRAAVKADPNDSDAELQLVSLLNALKGPDAARAELTERIRAGGRVFPYQLALARLDYAKGDIASSTKLLQQLIGQAGPQADTISAQVALADIYFSQKDYAAADSVIADILKADSRNTEGLRLRASTRIERGRFDDAIADLRSALNDQPRSPVLLNALAVAYERSGSIELADKAYFDAAKASNFSAAYGLNYIAFLRRRGLNDHAENVLNDLASRNPGNVAVLTALAQDKLARRDWTAAHTIADAIRRLDGDNTALADQIAGVAYGGQEKYNQSLEAFQSAFETNPAGTQSLAAVVATYLKAKQVDKAESYIRSVLSKNPQNAEAMVLKGAIEIEKNNLRQAELDFKKAIEVKPKDIAGYGALANLYVRQNKIDGALDVIRSGLQQNPKNFGLRMTLASILEVKRDFEGAIAEYEDMLKDQPGSMIVANNLASLLADHRTDKASLDRASTLAVLLKNTQVPQFKDTVGWIDYRRGNYKTAVSLLESAAAELPNVSLISYHLGMAYLATGSDTKASEQFQKAQNLAPNDIELKKKIDAALSEKKQKG